MIEVTGTAQRASWQSKTMPPVEQLDTGLWSIPVPFPNNPVRYTLSYLLLGEDSHGSTEALVIDPGMGSATGWEALTEGLHTAGIGVDEVTGIAVTHFHEDHLGQADRLRRASGAWVGLGAHGRKRYGVDRGVEVTLGSDRERLLAWGVPADRIPGLLLPEDRLKRISGLAEPDLRFAAGDRLPFGQRDVEVLATPGHTPDHLAFIDRASQRLFSGDHVLPRIVSHVALEEAGLPDPVGNFLRSLDVVEQAGVDEVCPAHEWRFRGLQARVGQLRRWHDGKIGAVAAAYDAGAGPVWEVASRLARTRPWEQLQGNPLRLVLSETASYLAYLASSDPSVQAEGLGV